MMGLLQTLIYMQADYFVSMLCPAILPFTWEDPSKGKANSPSCSVHNQKSAGMKENGTCALDENTLVKKKETEFHEVDSSDL